MSGGRLPTSSMVTETMQEWLDRGHSLLVLYRYLSGTLEETVAGISRKKMLQFFPVREVEEVEGKTGFTIITSFFCGL